MFRIQAFFFLIGVLIVALSGRAEPTEPSLAYYLPETVDYDPAVPTPGEFYGFEPGEWHLRNDQIVAYLQLLEGISERMQLVEFGRTHEYKPLLLLQVSSPENLARQEEIRAARSKVRGGQKLSASDPEPLIVWLAYSVHGNEPSGANSVPLLAYHLAAARGEGIEKLLENTVILIEPVVNPDGLDRFAIWANSHRGKRLVSDRNHREHQEGWPSGRTNHYLFDLNRDWLPLVHPESRGRLEHFHAWHPHLLGDFHEMGPTRTYFFQPGVPSRNNPLTPETNYELTARVAEINAKALDAIGSLYYTKETFDDFYVGKASTYPDLNGSVGILFEQASSRGHVQDGVHGPITFPFGIRNQLRASLGMLEAAVTMGEDFKAYSQNFFDTAMEEAKELETQAYIVEALDDPVRNTEFLDLLLRHQIRVYELGESLEVDGQEFEAGRDFIVPLQQPQMRLIRSLFERQTAFEENVFYDISTWVLPPAYNLEYADLEAAAYRSSLLGSRIEEAQVPVFGIEGESSYGYVFDWKSFEAPKVLQRILEAGLLAEVATRSFALDVNGPDFAPGTIFVPVSVQGKTSEEVFQILEEASAGTSVKIVPVTTGLTPAGINLGSPSLVPIEERKVLLSIGDGVTIGSAGTIWHLLDQRMEMKVSLVEDYQLRRVDLNDYNVIVLTSGSHWRMTSATIRSLKDWVRAGGTLITMQRAAEWAVSKDLVNAEFLTKKATTKVERIPYADADATERLKRISGAILSAHVDSTHPLGFGFEKESVALFRQGTVFMKPSKNPYTTPVLYHEEPVVSGYVSDENRELLAESAAVIAQSYGSGVVFLFADDPAFRGYWLGSSRLFLNALFFGSAVQNISVGEEEAVEME